VKGREFGELFGDGGSMKEERIEGEEIYRNIKRKHNSNCSVSPQGGKRKKSWDDLKVSQKRKRIQLKRGGGEKSVS